MRGESIYRQETGELRSAVRISGIDYREEKSNRKSIPALLNAKIEKKEERLFPRKDLLTDLIKIYNQDQSARRKLSRYVKRDILNVLLITIFIAHYYF